MIERTHDATFLNQVINHPEVRPWMGEPDAGELDLGPLLTSGYAFGIVEPECGGFVVIYQGGEDYEIHTMFLPEKRGPIAMNAAREAVDYIFDITDCERLYTQLPNGNGPAKFLAIRMGMVRVPDRPSAWRERGGEGEDWLLTKDAWLKRRTQERRTKMEADILEPPCRSQQQS